MRSHSVRPLLITAVTAFLAATALVLAIGYGWLGADVGRGANFCEAARDGLVKQPANTWSNAGFVIAGLAVAWHAGRATASPAVMSRSQATVYACVVSLLGPASAAMHATQSQWGGRLDMLSMYLVASFAAAYALTRAFGRRQWLVPVFILLLISCEAVAQLPVQVPLIHFTGNAAFALLLIVALVTELRMAGRPGTDIDLRWGLAAVATMSSAFGIWIAAQHGWCDPHSLLQGHAAWHLLDAVAAYLLFRMWRTERQVRSG